MSREHRFTALLLAGVMAIGLMLRLWNIGTEPYWGDEVLSLDIATHFVSAREMLAYLALVEFHPPLFYLLLRPWVALFGAGEAAVRALPLLFSLAAIPLTFDLGRRLFGTRTGLWAAAMIAVLPMQVEFGQEARPYAMFMALTLCAAIAAWEASRGGSWRWHAAYGVAAVLAWLLHYSALFGLLALASWWLHRAATATNGTRARALYRWFVTHGAAAIAAYAWIVPPLYKLLLGGVTMFGEQRPPTGMRPSVTLADVLDQLAWMTKEEGMAWPVLGGKAAALAAVTSAVFARATGEQRHDRDALAFCAWLFCGTVGLFVVSPHAVSYTPLYAKHAIVATVPAALLLGFLLSRLSPKRAAVTAAVVASSLVPFLAVVAGNDGTWDPMHRVAEDAAFVNANARPGDAVYVGFGFGRSNLQHYLDADIPVAEIYPIDYYGKDVGRSSATLGMLENEFQVRIRPASADAVREKLHRLNARYSPDRIWFVNMPKDRERILRLLRDEGWRPVYTAIPPLFPIDLLERP